MALSPEFAVRPLVLRQRVAAANTASDGSGTIPLLLREDSTTFFAKYRPFSCTADATADRLTITVPSIAIYGVPVTNGDMFELTAGTAPTGLANFTKYRAINLVYASDTSITFQVQNMATFAVIDITGTGTNPVLAFNAGTRIDKITFTNSQATAAASSAMVGKVFISDNNAGNFRLIGEVAIATATRSTTVIGTQNSISFPGGWNIPLGCQIGVTQSVYASAADQQDVIAYGAEY